MDSLSIHKVKGVQELILSADALPLYLSPYSPNLNPIEELWSKLKIFLRKWKIRDVKLLRNGIKAAVCRIITSDCQAGFNIRDTDFIFENRYKSSSCQSNADYSCNKTLK